MFLAPRARAFQELSVSISHSLIKCVFCASTFMFTHDRYEQSTIDVFVDQEMINFFRVTFLMERMCPLETGLGSTFNETVSFNQSRSSSTHEFDSKPLLFTSTSVNMPMRLTILPSQREPTRLSTRIIICDTSILCFPLILSRILIIRLQRSLFTA